MGFHPLIFPTSDFIVTPSGNWSTFAIGVGTPAQNFSMLFSTVHHGVLLPFYEEGVRIQNSFRSDNSTTWVASGPKMGKDIVTIGSERIKWTVGGNDSVDPLFGTIPHKFWDLTLIDYNWYAYTAGAAYRNAAASLIWGGFDKSYFGPKNPVFFPLSGGRYMNLSLAGITATNTLDGSTNLLSSPIPVLLDSSVADLHMPSVICDRFSSAFGLISDDSDPNLASFTVNTSVHQRLRRLNPLITFKLTDLANSSASIDIALSYQSLDFTFGNGSDMGNKTFFPIRDMGSAPNALFGRRFFQEIYVLVSPGISGTFTLAQSPIDNRAPDIIAIYKKGFNPVWAILRPVMAPLGVSVAVVLIAAIIHVFLRRKRKKALKKKLMELDRIWVQIHIAEPEGQGEEDGTEELGLLGHQVP